MILKVKGEFACPEYNGEVKRLFFYQIAVNLYTIYGIPQIHKSSISAGIPRGEEHLHPKDGPSK